MATDYKTIFMPYQLRTGDVLKNRMIYPNAQQSLLVGPESAPNEAMIDDLADFCYSGASLMCFGQFDAMGGGAAPGKHTGGHTNSPEFNYSDPRTFNYLAQLAHVAHMYGTKVLIKLAPAFPRGYTFWGGDAASLFPVPYDDRLKMPGQGTVEVRRPTLTMEQMKARVAPYEMCQQVIKDLVEMCKQYKRAGWDGMSFRADRFIDACTNLREDEYSGEIENRGKFQLDLYKAIKEACGDDFLIEIALMGDSPYGHDGKIPHGYTEDEFIRFVKLVEDYVDIVEVRERNGVGYQCTGWNSTLHDHPCLDYVTHLRQAGFKGTIAVNGGFNDPDEMEEILNKGEVDLISCGRTFRAEPRFLEKLRSGGKEVPTPCLYCNKCHGSPNGAPVHTCSVNPKDAQGHRLPAIIKPPVRSKKVAVIGGGPIGMRAACYAAERGHQVTLFEKAEVLGGKTRYYASLYPTQWPMERYRLWLVDELARRGVEVRTNCAPSPEDIEQEGFEAVIACTGSHEKRPPIEGADAAGVWQNQDVYEGRAVIGDKVVVVGGGIIGTETAIYLASLGKDVKVLTRQEVLMLGEARPHGPHYSFEVILDGLGYGGVGCAWTKYDNIKPYYNATTTKITPNSVTYVKDGEEFTLDCDTVIVSGGYEADTAEALKYAACTKEFYIAGDCDRRSTTIMSGTLQAFGKANLI